jgi:ABC-type Mn2+/Zn2+ transport system ATPase subunit
MDFIIKNCNSIDSTTISISESKLNIKFAPNGTGKSTIAKSIMLKAKGDEESLKLLLPFKYRKNNPTNISPEVIIPAQINNVMCFNEEYVNQFTFKSDELVNNSFDILIRTEAYIETEQEIDQIVQDIRQKFTNNPDLDILISSLKELSAAFKLTKTGLSKASSGMKGLSDGNKIEHIPEGLESFSPFIKSLNNVNWIDWQTKGFKEFTNLSDCCPFCSTNSDDKKDKIEKVSKEYDKNIIKNLVAIINVVDRLGDYFSEHTKDSLTTITNLPNGLEKEHEQFITNLKKQIDTLIGKLEHLKSLSGFDFKIGEKVTDKLTEYKLDLQFFSKLHSDKTERIISQINESIENVIVEAGILQGKISIQRSKMTKLIEKHQNDINNFLSYAGFKYKVEILGDDDKGQLKLFHIEHDQCLIGGNQHLSFGERNAFAIVLFMYECLAKKPNLIVLDDPISSFDKNKKYAILEMLFRRHSNVCLKGQTVLMLTHDVEPIIDTIKSVATQFNNQVKASYLQFNDGEIIEEDITKEDIKSFAQICKDVLTSSATSVVKLIYLRRYYEIMDEKGDAYQVLSNLFHKRNVAIDSRREATDGAYPEMEKIVFEGGCSEIEEKIIGFDYQINLSKITNHQSLKPLYDACLNGYEKLQIFRLFGVDVENSVIRKFINETYHIENEYICQLDPTQFDIIPEYVRLECDKSLAEAGL